ncbi:hypothetical protein J6590_021454 [Homalodisca vitripennis]|nr:hypothetical protein J6590_021454 [Homalodisca vitripennis]
MNSHEMIQSIEEPQEKDTKINRKFAGSGLATSESLHVLIDETYEEEDTQCCHLDNDIEWGNTWLTVVTLLYLMYIIEAIVGYVYATTSTNWLLELSSENVVMGKMHNRLLRTPQTCHMSVNYSARSEV